MNRIVKILTKTKIKNIKKNNSKSLHHPKHRNDSQNFVIKKPYDSHPQVSNISSRIDIFYENKYNDRED